MGIELTTTGKSYPVGSEFKNGFSSQLSWSHYRALMRVAKPDARDFYERETIECCWDKRTLERQIHSQYYERMLASQNPRQMIESARREILPRPEGIETLKNPYVLEFLGLPEMSSLHEKQLESAIITHLQNFLLELGKGFAFVARQKRICFEDTDLYVDLVFYNCILKCLPVDRPQNRRDIAQGCGAHPRALTTLATARKKMCRTDFGVAWVGQARIPGRHPGRASPVRHPLHWPP